MVLGDFDSKFERWLKKQIEEVILYIGDPGRLLFGTDWPLASMESYVDFMRKIALPNASKDLILYQNALRLFRLPIAEPLKEDAVADNQPGPPSPLAS